MNEEISFGDELDQEIEEQIQDSYRPDGKILGPMRYVPLKLPKERIERMMNSYGTVCLQDFSDIYHLTDEQRSERNEFYQVETKMRKCQAKYRKIPQFINAWRITIEALKAVANKNNIMDPDEFVKKVLRKKIRVYGIKYPRYTGANKKEIDWKVVSEYIMDPTKDPHDFDQKPEVSSYDVVDPDSIEEINRVMFGGTLEQDLARAEELYKRTETIVYDDEKLDEGEFSGIYASEISKKEFKEFIKYSGFIEGVRNYKKQQEIGSSIKSFAFEFSENDFEAIKEMDTLKGYKSKSDYPEFTGCMLKKSDIAAYEAEIREWEEDNILVECAGRVRTLREAHEIEIKQMLEDNGYDLHMFYSYDADRKKLEKIEKRDKKREKKLKNQLLKLNNRKEKRANGINTKKKKHKKKKKDKTGYKSQVIEATKDLLTPSNYDSWDDYTKQMEGWDD